MLIDGKNGNHPAGQRKEEKDATVPRLLMVVSRQGKAQRSKDVSKPVPGQ